MNGRSQAEIVKLTIGRARCEVHLRIWIGVIGYVIPRTILGHVEEVALLNTQIRDDVPNQIICQLHDILTKNCDASFNEACDKRLEVGENVACACLLRA